MSGDERETVPERQEQPDLGLRRRFFSWPTLIAYLVAGSVLALTASRVLNIDWGGMWEQIRSTRPLLYILALILYYVGFWFRGLRWVLIARTARMHEEPGVKLPSATTAAVIILMGWFANSVAFMRLGDAYRGWAFARESGTNFPASLGTVLAERVQDMGAVLILLLAGAIALAFTHEVDLPAWVLGGAIILVAALVALMFVMRAFGMRLAAYLPGRFQHAYGRFHTGTLSSFRARDLPLQVALGGLGWATEIGRLYLVARGMGVEVTLLVALFAALANAMLTTIPTPGGFGFVEGGLTGVLIIVGLSHTDAFALTVVDRSISWLSIIVIGGLLFLAWQIRGARRASSEPRIAVAAGSGAEPSDGEGS